MKSGRGGPKPCLHLIGRTKGRARRWEEGARRPGLSFPLEGPRPPEGFSTLEKGGGNQEGEGRKKPPEHNRYRIVGGLRKKNVNIRIPERGETPAGKDKDVRSRSES